MSTGIMKPSFGWDLAGYGKSGMAPRRADPQDNTISATVFRALFICCPKLNIVCRSTTPWRSSWKCSPLAKLGNTPLDVPVDLQLLARVVDHRKDERLLDHWQLVKRPVDHIFKALEPLGSNLGFAVARTSHLLGRLVSENAGLKLGENVFETYPAATLQLVCH